MDHQQRNAVAPMGMIDTPVPSPTRSGKVKPLRKLNLQKDQEHPVPKSLVGLLQRNSLGTYPETKVVSSHPERQSL